MYKKKWIRLLLLFYRKLKRDRIDLYASQASFFMLMSAIPMLMLMFTLLQFTPLTQEMVLDTLARILNEEIMATVREIVGNVYRGSVTLISFAAVSLWWVSGKGIMSLSNGLNNIHNRQENRNYFLLRVRASVYTVLLIIAFILALGILVFGFRFQNYMIDLFPALEDFQEILIYLQTLIALCLLILIFTALYIFLPNGKKTFVSQFAGAVFATLSWCIYSYVFSVYLSYAKNMSVIYGGLVTLVALMLWLYGCMYLWFIGAEINAYIENQESFILEKAS